MFACSPPDDIDILVGSLHCPTEINDEEELDATSPALAGGTYPLKSDDKYTFHSNSSKAIK